MADSTQGASGDDLVVPDEWRVRAFVAHDLSNRAAQVLGEQIESDLSAWVGGLSERLTGSASVRVSIER
jgi:hypothetical protein